MPPQIDVLGLGSAAVDEILYVETYPSPDTKTRVLRRELRCGGLTATALVAATRLGARCAYAGRLGLDYESRLVEEYLARERLDLSQASRAAENGVVSSTIILAMDTGSRNVFSRSSGLTGAHESAPPEALIRNSRSLFVDHHGVPGAIRVPGCPRRRRSCRRGPGARRFAALRGTPCAGEPPCGFGDLCAPYHMVRFSRISDSRFVE